MFVCLFVYTVCCCCIVPGDEVVEWNCRNLRGLTFEEVYEIIFESKLEPQVELIVQRHIR